MVPSAFLTINLAVQKHFSEVQRMKDETSETQNNNSLEVNLRPKLHLSSKVDLKIFYS